MTVLNDSLKRFKDEMSQLDPLAHVLLKGHLLLEEHLVRILGNHAYHREHLSEAKLTFFQKMNLCRAFCLRKNKLGEWELLAAINSLRNDLAHNLGSEDRKRKLDRVKDLYFRESKGLEGIDDIRKQDDATIVMAACAHSQGFLIAFEDDARSFRQLIHGIDREMNPDLDPFPL